MATTIRVASFNVENLFSRAKILNLASNARAAELLRQVAGLQELIRQDSYSAEDKERIVELYHELDEYITVREDRKHLFNKGKTAVVADGAGDWSGEIVFKRERFSDETRANTARVIKTIKADVLCVVEAEDRPTLGFFNAELLDSRKFKFPMLIDGNDQRGIDVGVLSDYPIAALRTQIFDGAANSRTFARDCLRAELTLPAGESLHLLCNHFTSKSGGEASTDPRRVRQATRVAEILGEYDLTHDLVIVAGDLNDVPTRPPLQPLLGVAHLHDVLALQFPDDPGARWTYHFRQPEQIDYLLVSEPLKDAFVEAGVERRGIAELAEITGGAEQPFDSVTHWRNAASDHGAVWAEFALP